MDLTQFDEGYNQAEVQVSNFVEVPDGKYQVQIEKVEIVSTSTGKPMIKWQFHIRGGNENFIGKKLFKNSVITENTLKMIKSDLMTMGVELKKFSDLPSHLSDLLDLGLEVFKKTSGTDPQGKPNVNVYINGNMGKKFPPVGTATSAGATIPANAVVTDFDGTFDAGDLPF